MNRIVLKLRSHAGESIGETLVALVIASLALLMLAGAVSSAANLVTKSRTTLDAYYAANNQMVIQAGDPAGTVDIALNEVDGVTGEVGGAVKLTQTGVQADYYQNQSDADALSGRPVIAYTLHQ